MNCFKIFVLIKSVQVLRKAHIQIRPELEVEHVAAQHDAALGPALLVKKLLYVRLIIDGTQFKRIFL
jgi:hypothetical protein